MGIFGSKEDEDFVNDPAKIFWDDSGNLVYGKAHWMKQDKQIREIMQLDRTDDKDEEKLWYIMDSAWVSSWLAYVHFDKENAPAPGPCRNDRLLTWDYLQGKYVARFGLYMAVNDRAGDYRRVTKETWDKYCQLYPGSGPTITMMFNAKKMDETGMGVYDCSTWNIENPPPPPENKEKKVKKKLLDTFSGKKKKEEEAEEVRPSEESKADDTPFRSLRDNTISINSIQGSSTGYAKLDSSRGINTTVKDDRASTGSLEGLIEKDKVRQSSVAGGNQPDAYIEDVFFGKD